MKKLKKSLSLLLVFCMLFSLTSLSAFAVDEPVADPAPETESVEAVSEDSPQAEPAALSVGSKPADGTTSGQPFASGTGGSSNFRIPALVTLSNGSLVAAADARWNHSGDGWGLDTIVSRSSDDGATWNYTFANYLGDNGNVYNSDSTAFIDPALVVTSDDTIYMLVDLYPHGTYIGNVKAGTGFDDQGRLLLSGDSGKSFGYYLENGAIYTKAGAAVTGYTVDEYYNVTGNGVNTNLFFSDSPYQVLSTSYLYLTKSTDGGATWSAPMMLNSQVKNDNDMFYGVGPGRGLVTSTGRIIFPCYTYTTTDGNTSVIYSDDNGKTWNRSADMTSQSSEAALVEADGNIYMFTRHGGYYVSKDNGTTWSGKKEVGVNYTTSCQLSAITYSRTIDGKTAILLSAPTNSRTSGKIFVGLVQEDGSINWKYTYSVNGSNAYAYSCLTELADGRIGLLYENASASITYTTLSIEAIASGAEIGEQKPDTNLTDDATGVAVNFGANDVPGMTVTRVYVDALADRNYVAYDITPDNYTGSADVTIPLTAELKACAELTGFVVEADGSITWITGSSDGGSYTFTTPHFSVMGVAEVLANDVTDVENVTLYVGQTATITDSTGNYESSYTGAGLDTGIATVTVKGTSIEGGTTKTLGSTVSMNSNGTYTGVISDGTNYLVLNGSTISSTTDINEATEWTVTRSGRYSASYTIKSGSYYLSYNDSNSSLSVSTSSSSWSYSGGFYYTSWFTSYYISTNNGSWQVSSTNSNKGQLYSVTTTTTDPVDATDITITGVAVGETSVVVGNTQYNITVKEMPDYVDLSNTPFTANTGVGKSKAVTKLTTSVGLTFDVDLANSVPTSGAWSIADTNIATVDQNGKVTGKAAGETTLTYTVNGVSYTMPVVIRQDATSGAVKIYDFYLSEVTDTVPYYVVMNGTTYSELIEAQEGEAIYLSFNSNANTAVDFFAKPNEGYALTRMSSTNSAGDYMALNSDTPAGTDFCTRSNAAGYNQINAFGSDFVYAVVQQALDASCDGGMGWTRSSVQTNGVTSDLTFRSEKLPTVSKEVATVNGVAYTEGMVAHVGEKVVFNVTVTQYAAQDNITYSNASLKDNLTGATFAGTNSATQTVSGLSNTALTQNKTITYQVEYTITDDDLDKTIVNTVDLSYTYKSQYSSGSFGGTANADAKFTAASFNPQDIVVDFGLPVTIDYSDANAHGRYDLVSGTASYGDVTVTGNKVTYTPKAVLQGVDTVTLTNAAGGTYTFRVYPATTVYYEEGFADLTGFNGGGTGTVTQATETVGGKTNNYGYDPAYANQVDASSGTQATSDKAGSTAVFTFTGTGVDIYANSTPNTGRLMIQVKKADGATVKFLQVDTALLNGSTAATQGQNVNGYNVPVASISGLTHGSYTVTVTHIAARVKNEQGVYESVTKAVNLDGFRVYGTLAGDTSAYVSDGEANPTFVELRDQVLAALNVDTASGQYAGQIAENVWSQVYATAGQNASVSAVALNNNANIDAQDLLDNGPKNELYLRPNQSVVFKVNQDVQIGLKALNAAVNYSINGTAAELNSSTDMFYSAKAGTITITNASGGILAITDVKFVGGASAAFLSLTEEDLVPALLSLGFEEEPSVDPVDPTDPTTPVDPVDPTDPTDPEQPINPVDPEQPTDPVDPEQPTDPVDPEQPTDPTDPEEPTDPGNGSEGGGTGDSGEGSDTDPDQDSTSLLGRIWEAVKGFFRKIFRP